LPARDTVFVVDDDAGMLKATERVLMVHGFRAELFDSVEEFQGRAKLSNAFCLILDINLNGKSGIDLKNQLSGSGISLPVIFITADDSNATRKAALDAGCIAYLTKPFLPASLIAAVRDAYGIGSSFQSCPSS
jgi:FixJ family two-component response regulator